MNDFYCYFFGLQIYSFISDYKNISTKKQKNDF